MTRLDLTADQIKEYWIDVFGYSEQDMKMANYTAASMLAKMSNSEVEDCLTYSWSQV